MVEWRSSAAPSGGAQRLESLLRWGIGWRGRAARTPPMAAPTQTAQKERTCTSSFFYSMSIQSWLFIGSSLIVLFSFRFVFPTTRLGPESQFSDFLDGLGPAQIVGRQTLATPPMGKVLLVPNQLHFFQMLRTITSHYGSFFLSLREDRGRNNKWYECGLKETVSRKQTPDATHSVVGAYLRFPIRVPQPADIRWRRASPHDPLFIRCSI